MLVELNQCDVAISNTKRGKFSKHYEIEVLDESLIYVNERGVKMTSSSNIKIKDDDNA